VKFLAPCAGQPNRPVQMPQLQRLAALSIPVGIVVLAFKLLAYYVTGSVALFSDALESIVNVAAAIAAYLAIRLAAQPADHNHPYGHHKAEYLASVTEGALIVVAALIIVSEAYDAFVTPRALTAPIEGLVINGVATVINAVWAAVLLRTGRAQRSPALIADGRHLYTDVISSVGVLVGVGLAVATGIPILDPILAVAVAGNVLWSGWVLMRDSLSGLMDTAAEPAVLEKIRSVISDQGAGALEAHDLRTRHAGRATFIDFHLVVPGEMTVREAHDICDRIEDVLRAEIGDAFITIHVEPEHKAKHAGIVVL
jgi:cation diffusion facilitator family transporter